MTDRDIPLSSFVLAGRWRFRARIGRGADGVVYVARDEKTDRDVAIKVYDSLSGHATDTVRNRVTAEAEIARIIDSPHLVDVVHAGVAPAQGGAETGYLVMEYLEGDTLREALDRRVTPMAPVEAALLLRTILSAVATLHRKGFVHRDLKPENIFLLAPHAASTAGVQVKLFDFGAALPVERAHTGIARGTPLYCAPEVARRAPRVGRQADVYTLGLILYELLTGLPPLDLADTAGGMVARHVYGELDPLPDALAASPLADVYRIATEKKPEDRYPDADAMAAAITALRQIPSGRLPKPSPFMAPAVDDGSVLPGVNVNGARVSGNGDDD